MDRMGMPLSPSFAAFEKADEISVTRRVYRDGNGEFLINKVGCRLKDIHELFMDTGVGKRAYSIIEQGQIDRMINVKPEERRHIFEEVAGITKYKAKKKEAEKKLDLTRQNLVRIQDIITELEKQLRSLKVQAVVQKNTKELKSELEYVDMYFLGRKLDETSQKMGNLLSQKGKLVESRAEAEAAFSEIDAHVTQSEIKRVELEQEISN